MFAINFIKLTPNKSGLEKEISVKVLSIGTDEITMKLKLEQAVENYIVDFVGKNNYQNVLMDPATLNTLIQKHAFVAREIVSLPEYRVIHVFKSSESGWVRSHKTSTLDSIFTLCKIESVDSESVVRKPVDKVVKYPLMKISEEITKFDHSNLKHVTIDTSKTAVKQSILPIVSLRHVKPEEQNIRDSCIVVAEHEKIISSKKKD
jgi:hypothetical protein